MERLLIILAVLVCASAGVAAVSMSARGRREPLRLDSELDEADEHLLIDDVGAPASPIDRSAPVLDERLLDERIPDERLPAPEPHGPRPVEPPRRGLPDAAR